MNPDVPLVYGNLVPIYLILGRLDWAETALRDGEKRSDYQGFHFERYRLAFLHADAGGRAQQVAWSVGKPGIEDWLLIFEANTAAYSGRLARARELSGRAEASAQRAGDKEALASDEGEAGLREALFGNSVEARRRDTVALSSSRGRDVEYKAGVALSFAADVDGAEGAGR